MTGTAGILNLLKPAGMTSHDCISFLRRITGIKRIGHTGTLDPMAVGVLPVCIGMATRVIDYMDGGEKSYRCELLLGVETDTQDIWGTVIRDRQAEAAAVTEERLRAALASLEGEILQTPPAYSAVKVDGRRLYEYARAGETAQAKPRPAWIRRIALRSYDPDVQRGVFDVDCGRGTYVRSLCSDAGDALGCGAAMSFLLRTASGPFRLESAVTPEEAAEHWRERLLPPDAALDHLGRLEIPAARVLWFCNGGSLRPDEVELLRLPAGRSDEDPRRFESRKSIRGESNGYTVYSGSAFLGVARFEPVAGLYMADKVLCR